MNTIFKNNKVGILLFALGVLVSTLSTAGGWGRGPVYSHDDGYGYGRGGYYDRGGYAFGGGWGWGGPNVIINVPVERYYPPLPVCENVEVCDAYDECWIERYCN